jgi:hypothetical protein
MRRAFLIYSLLIFSAAVGCERMSHTYTNEGPGQEPGKNVVHPNAHDRVFSEGASGKEAAPDK